MPTSRSLYDRTIERTPGRSPWTLRSCATTPQRPPSPGSVPASVRGRQVSPVRVRAPQTTAALQQRAKQLWERSNASLLIDSPAAPPLTVPDRVPVLGAATCTRELGDMQARRERIQRLCDEGILHLHKNEDDLIVGYTLAQPASSSSLGQSSPNVSPIRGRQAQHQPQQQQQQQQNDISSFLSSDDDPLILHMRDAPPRPAPSPAKTTATTTTTTSHTAPKQLPTEHKLFTQRIASNLDAPTETEARTPSVYYASLEKPPSPRTISGGSIPIEPLVLPVSEHSVPSQSSLSLAVSPIQTRLSHWPDASGESPLGLEGLDDVDDTFDSTEAPWEAAPAPPPSATPAPAPVLEEPMPSTTALEAELEKERTALREEAERSKQLEEELAKQRLENDEEKRQARIEAEAMQARLDLETTLRDEERAKQESFLDLLERQQHLLKREVDGAKEERMRDQHRVQYQQLQDLMAEQQKQLFDVVNQLQERQTQRESALEQKNSDIQNNWAGRIQTQLANQQHQLYSQLDMLQALQKKQEAKTPHGDNSDNALLQRQVQDQILFLKELQGRAALPGIPATSPPKAPSPLPSPETSMQHSRLSPVRPGGHSPSCRTAHCSCHVMQQPPALGVDLRKIPGSSTRRTRPIDSRSTGAALRERTERRLSGPRLGNHHPHATMGGHGTPAPAPAPPAPTPPASGLRRGGDWTGHLVDHLAAPSPATNAPTPTPSHTPTYKSLYLQRKRYSDPKTQDASEVPGSGYLLRSPLPVPGAETGNARRKLTPSPARRRGAAGAERREWSTDSVSPPPSTAVLSVSPHRVSLGGGGGGGGGGGNLARPVGPGGEHNEHRSAF